MHHLTARHLRPGDHAPTILGILTIPKNPLICDISQQLGADHYQQRVVCDQLGHGTLGSVCDKQHHDYTISGS